MESVLGITWPEASSAEFIILFIILVIIIVFFILLKFYFKLKNDRINNNNLFLFKMKRLGLSNFQIRIINNMIDILRLSNPNIIFEQPELFEKSIGAFMQFLMTSGEKTESLGDICKDITITYGKLYYPSEFRKPLEDIIDIETGILLYFIAGDNDVFLGKIISKEGRILDLRLFRTARKIQQLKAGQDVRVYIWRIGDAEYEFSSKLSGVELTTVRIEAPKEFKRDKEFRHPYIEVIIPCVIEKAEPGPLEENEKINGTMFKINDFEAMVRLSGNIDYRHEYYLEFEMMEFKFKIKTSALAHKTFKDNDIFYLTLKFVEMSEPAKNVLKRYMYEHLG